MLYERNEKKFLVVSIAMNILLIVAVIILILYKIGILTRLNTGMTNYSYLTNPQYEANLTMFKLIDGDTDVVFAGDSITAYGRFSEFFPEVSLMNRGIGSDTTEGLYNRMDEILSHHPKKIFIMIGINDMSRNISRDKSLEYYEKIIFKIQQESPDCKIYVESVLPIITDNLDAINEYNESLKKLCDKKGVEYIDLYKSFLIEDKVNEVLFSTDGVHLNGNGYKIWIDTIYEIVSE